MFQNSQAYQFDTEKKIWKRPEAKPFAYADGVEGKLLEILHKVKDKSVFSSELREYQKDWPTTYYFSPARSNILRPFENKLLKNASVLELGAGCGAITRYLGESAKVVIAVEGSEDRAAIARERCSELDNVTIISDSIQNLPANLGKYDVVTLIGVLEYAGRFGLKPEELLEKARSFLKDDGVLILAIENKLGMKYLAGVPEDHLGLSWAGVVNGYSENGVATWSRKELINILKKAGYEYLEQFIALPDYKLPLTIITQEGIDMPEQSLDLAPILANQSRIFEIPPLFNQTESNISMYKAGLLPDMADSLCFIASPSARPDKMKNDGTLVEHYGVMAHMKKDYAKKMRIVDDNGNIRIKRKTLFPMKKNGNFYYLVEDEPYYRGKRLGDMARKVCMRKGWTIAEFAESLRPWVDYILAHKTGNNEIDGKYLDFNPFNAILGEDGIVYPFDLEWRSQKAIDVHYLILRGLINTISKVLPIARPAPDTDLQWGTLIKKIFEYFNLEFDYEYLKNIWDGETLDSYLRQNLPLDTFLQRQLRVNVDNAYLYIFLLDLCTKYGLHPLAMEKYIDKLTKNLKSQEKTISILRKYIDNMKRANGEDRA